MTELFFIFLRLGIIGFGGPIALVALIEQTICNEKKWLTTKEFAEIFSICKLLPGPVAVQVAMYVGYRLRGRLGGLIAGIGFNLPAVILMTIFSIVYTHTNVQHSARLILAFEFMQDATLGIIVLAIVSMSKGYINSWKLIMLTILAGIIIFLLPTYEPLIIIAFGFVGVMIAVYQNGNHQKIKLPAVAVSLPKIWHGIMIGMTLSMVGQLLWIFFKAGEFSFGTGLAIIPLLHGDLVTTHHWLTDKQFLDGVTLGQITPGPTTVSVVFFGYKIAGFLGILIAIIGFYTPAVLNTLVIVPILWKRLTKTQYLQSFLHLAFPAIIGGIISASLKIGAVSVKNWYDLLLLIISVIVITRKILPIWAVIPLYGVAGFIFSYI